MAAFEVLAGAGVVVRHNVYRVLPNEVPILDLIFIFSLAMRRVPLRFAGLVRPSCWKLALTTGLCSGACLQLKDLVTKPVGRLFWKQPERVSTVLTSVHHNTLALFQSLAIVWIFAAFGEELGYRALLLGRSADALSCSRP
jgi:membrane protease YdiL (CAAX protease family)